MELARYIDHTLLKATATESDIVHLCEEARQFEFYAVCVNSGWTALCKQMLKDTSVCVATTIGFPLGAMSTAAKIAEALKAIEDGADEIDMVMNIGLFKTGNYTAVESEIRSIKQAVGKNILKVIIETCYLDLEEKENATDLACRAGADFVKTSTGFGGGGATLEDVILMKAIASGRAKIKASGGIKDQATALAFIKDGADRIGTSSGVAIVTGETGAQKTY
jgi:deoxyribose-phosphate aldolase